MRTFEQEGVSGTWKKIRNIHLVVQKITPNIRKKVSNVLNLECVLIKMNGLKIYSVGNICIYFNYEI